MKDLISSDRFEVTETLSSKVVNELLELSDLKVIQFYDSKKTIPNAETLTNLNSLFHQRKDLTLRLYGYSDFWSDISFLRELPELERLDWESDHLSSFQSLYKLKKLRHLGLGFSQPKPKFCLKFLEDFQPTLESLSLQGDFKNATSTIPKLESLKTIWFCSTKLDNLEFLNSLELESFNNYGSRVKGFDFLKNLQTLKKIWIKTNTTLESVDFLKDLPNLEEIELLYVSKITKLPALSNLIHLKKLLIFECNRLEEIEELRQMNSCAIMVSGKKIKGNYYKNKNFKSF